MLCLGLALSPGAWSASGQIDSFGASQTTVQAGSTVDFFVSFSVNTSSRIDGGNDAVEPAPVEGDQQWVMNWYWNEAESVSAIFLQAGGQNFADYPSSAPGSGYSNGWSFSLLFPTEGSFDIVVGGGWSAVNAVSYGSEIASRTCTGDGAGGLSCSSWVYSYPQYDSTGSADGSFEGRSITINVTAVPEPMAAALWLAGLGCLVAGRSVGMRRRRAPAANRR
ncbi:MAG: PEP-CTERM sorting domain-containing protein [Methyloversatilis sp.]|nr:PEP-CTERM sorting domain-containing protein [Methyloversatilis sp.]